MLVGTDPASQLYVHMKQQAAEKLGFALRVQRFSGAESDQELIEQIETWNKDEEVDGILVQLPLPNGHDETVIVQTIEPRKDVDGFHEQNISALLAHEPVVLSPVHEGTLRLINISPVRINGAQVSVIANSKIFSAPLAHLLQAAGAHILVMSADELTKDWLKESDIVIIAIGRPGFLIPEMVKETAVIIDVGTTRDEIEKVHGDVNITAFINTECVITPVPGGVGPITIAILMQNLLKAADRARGYKATV